MAYRAILEGIQINMIIPGKRRHVAVDVDETTNGRQTTR
jgi:hypothetical protein